MVSQLEMYSKFGLQIGFAQPNGANWSENGQWPTAISSSAHEWGAPYLKKNESDIQNHIEYIIIMTI